MRGLRIAGDSLGGYSWERGKGGVEGWTDQSLLKLTPFPVPLYVYGENGRCGVNGERIRVAIHGATDVRTFVPGSACKAFRNGELMRS